MGWFGVDYNKPGPGVDKHAPKKKSFVVFFEIYFRKFWKLVVANLLYVLVSLPILTSGLANAGLTYITRNFSREKHAFTSDFFDIIRRNWKQALPVGIINTLLGAAIAYALVFYGVNIGNLTAMIFFIILSVLAALFICMRYYIYMLMITFKFSFKQLYKNSFIMASSCLKPNLIITGSLLLFYGLIGALMWVLGSVDVRVPLALLLFLYVLVIPSFRSLLIQHCIFPSVKKLIIDPYYEANPDADKSRLRMLNILPEENEETKDEEETVFVDRGREQKAEKANSDKKSDWKFPTQHTEAERRAGRIGQFSAGAADDDDDDTI